MYAIYTELEDEEIYGFYRNLVFPLFKAQFVMILPLHTGEDAAERYKALL